MKSIYDVNLKSAEGNDYFLDQYKGKVTLLVNTTVGCGNANQLEVLQWLQEKYNSEDFEIIAIPTNDYCGVGITSGKWAKGITCGLDSKNYGEEVYGVTFKYSEMINSCPNDLVSPTVGSAPGHNGLGEPYGEPHELYKLIAEQMINVKENKKNLGIKDKSDYISPDLNSGFDNGVQQGGNFEKYLIDRDGYIHKHYHCSVLNYKVEKTKWEDFGPNGENRIVVGEDGYQFGGGRTMEIFQEEYALIQKDIEELINGKSSIINPISENIYA